MKTLGEEFRARVAAVDARLSQVSEQQWSQPYAAGSWLRKEVLGHLIDSAANNHIRFVNAALNGRFTGPGYEQNSWVRIHDYAHTAWDTILGDWRSQNSLLGTVVSRLSEDQLQARCQVSTDPEMSLREVVLSYLDHLDHHVDDIVRGA